MNDKLSGKIPPRLLHRHAPKLPFSQSVDVWTWGELQKQGFTDMKAMSTTTLALAHYDASRPTTASTDESSSGFTTKGSTSSDTQGSLRLH